MKYKRTGRIVAVIMTLAMVISMTAFIPLSSYATETPGADSITPSAADGNAPPAGDTGQPGSDLSDPGASDPGNNSSSSGSDDDPATTDDPPLQPLDSEIIPLSEPGVVALDDDYKINTGGTETGYKWADMGSIYLDDGDVMDILTTTSPTSDTAIDVQGNATVNGIAGQPYTNLRMAVADGYTATVNNLQLTYSNAALNAVYLGEGSTLIANGNSSVSASIISAVHMKDGATLSVTDGSSLAINYTNVSPGSVSAVETEGVANFNVDGTGTLAIAFTQNAINPAVGYSNITVNKTGSGAMTAYGAVICTNMTVNAGELNISTSDNDTLVFVYQSPATGGSLKVAEGAKLITEKGNSNQDGINASAVPIFDITCDGTIDLTGKSYGLYAGDADVSIQGSGSGFLKTTGDAYAGLHAGNLSIVGIKAGITSLFDSGVYANTLSVDDATVNLGSAPSSGLIIASANDVTLTGAAVLNIASSDNCAFTNTADTNKGFEMEPGTTVSLTNNFGSAETHPFTMSAAGTWDVSGDATSLDSGYSDTDSPVKVTVPSGGAAVVIKLLPPVDYTIQIGGTGTPVPHTWPNSSNPLDNIITLNADDNASDIMTISPTATQPLYDTMIDSNGGKIIGQPLATPYIHLAVTVNDNATSTPTTFENLNLNYDGTSGPAVTMLANAVLVVHESCDITQQSTGLSYAMAMNAPSKIIVENNAVLSVNNGNGNAALYTYADDVTGAGVTFDVEGTGGAALNVAGTGSSPGISGNNTARTITKEGTGTMTVTASGNGVSAMSCGILKVLNAGTLNVSNMNASGGYALSMLTYGAGDVAAINVGNNATLDCSTDQTASSAGIYRSSGGMNINCDGTISATGYRGIIGNFTQKLAITGGSAGSLTATGTLAGIDCGFLDINGDLNVYASSASFYPIYEYNPIDSVTTLPQVSTIHSGVLNISGSNTGIHNEGTGSDMIVYPGAKVVVNSSGAGFSNTYEMGVDPAAPGEYKWVLSNLGAVGDLDFGGTPVSTSASDPATIVLATGGSGTITLDYTPYVCEITDVDVAAGGDDSIIGGYMSLDAALAAITNNAHATIHLLQDITYDPTFASTCSISDRDITFDLTDYTDLDNPAFNLIFRNDSGTGLELYDSTIDYIDNSANTDGTFQAISKDPGVNGDGLYIEGGSCELTYAEANTWDAIECYGAEVTVYGNVAATGDDGYGIEAYVGSTVTVTGDVTADGDWATGVCAYLGADVTVGGSVSVTGYSAAGVWTDSGATVTVGAPAPGSPGSVTATGDEVIAVYAQGSGTTTVSTVTVWGDVTGDSGPGTIAVPNPANALGVEADGYSNVTVNGAVSALGDYSLALYVYDGGIAKVTGDVTATGDGAIGVGAAGDATDGDSTVTINGDVTADSSGGGSYVNGIIISAYSIVTVTGNVYGIGDVGTGIWAFDGGIANVAGNVTATGDGAWGVCAEDNSGSGSGGNVTVDGDVTVVGDYSLGAQSDGYENNTECVYAVGKSTVNITGNATLTLTSPLASYPGHDLTIPTAVNSDASDVAIGGDVVSGGIGVVAGDDSAVKIAGSVDASYAGVVADSGTTLTIGNDLTSAGFGIFSMDSSTVDVTGNVDNSAVPVLTSVGLAILAGTGGNVTVSGDVMAYVIGVDVEDGSAVTIGGSLTAGISGTGGIFGVLAANGSAADVSGDVTVYGNDSIGVIAVGESLSPGGEIDSFGAGGGVNTLGENDSLAAKGILVNRAALIDSLSAMGGGMIPAGVIDRLSEAGGSVNTQGEISGLAANGTMVNIRGNVTAAGTNSVGAFADTGGKAVIGGTLTGDGAGNYIFIATTPYREAIDNSTTSRAGYFEYTDNTSYVWVKDMNTYTLNVVAGTGGSVLGAATGQYAQGAAISATAKANSGYRFTGWTVSGASITGGNSANPAAFNMPIGAVTLTANFARTGGGGGGGGTPAPTTNGTAGTTGTTTVVDETPADTTQPPTTPTQPVTPIVDQPAPQAPGPGTGGQLPPGSDNTDTGGGAAAMATLNLVLTIVTALLMIIMLATIPAARRSGRNERMPMRLITIVTTVVSFIVLFATQDFSGRIVAFDGWTPVFIAILVVTAILAAIAAKAPAAEAKE